MTWKHLIQRAMKKNNDLDSPVSVTVQRWNPWFLPPDQEMAFKTTLEDALFDMQPGELEDSDECSLEFRFTLWTPEWVYFPAVYDGAYWVASVPRNPCLVATAEVGGG